MNDNTQRRKDIKIPESEMAKQEEFIREIRTANEAAAETAGRKKLFKLTTYGCQMNENDSERLAGMLVRMGYEPTEEEGEADLIIYNTCCVRENAEFRVYGHLGALKKLKREKSGLMICVCGCMMQQKEVVEHIRKTYRHVDLVFGTHNLYKFPELLYTAIHDERGVIEVWESAGLIAEGVPIERKEGIKAWVTVMYGCNNFCSYCIVPYVRGRERSRSMGDIISEVEELAAQGFKEITLLGQNVNSYGKDLDDGLSFAKLLRAVNEVKGIERIRFMTSHPKDLSDQLIEAMKECQKVCKNLHLPIQAGSTKILREMNRKYSKEQYLELVERIRKSLPGIALTTDIIVGFPGETEEDFKDTLSVLETVRFDGAYTFLYSKRTGTPAAQSTDQVPEDVKKARFERLIEVQNRISKEINDRLLGAVTEVLVEGRSKSSDETYTGRTGSNKIVNFKADCDLTGQLVKVRINKTLTWSLEAELANKT